MKIAFLGDIALFRDEMLSQNWKEKFAQIKDYLKKYDLVVANLETPITDINKTYICKGMHLKSDKELIELIKYIGVNLVCISNNHIYDFGKKGFEDTLKVLDDYKIPYYGTSLQNNKNIELYNNIVFHGFCCYSTNAASYDSNVRGVLPSLTEKNLIKVLEDDKRNGKLSVLSLHWGDEYSHYPNEKQYDLMVRLSKKYRFIVHGHHAHVIQGIEKYNDSVVAYNLGNFCFDECKSLVVKDTIIKQSPANREGLIFVVDIEENDIESYYAQGIRYTLENGIELIDYNEKLELLSSEIDKCHTDEYKDKSIKCVAELKNKNLNRKNLKWFISKMNYYSIGAKLLSYYYKIKYKKAY